MASSTEQVLEDLQRVVGELGAMARSAAEGAGECAEDAAQGLKEKIEQARDCISDVERSAGRKFRRGWHAADRRVRDNPWGSVAAVAAVAFIAGLLLSRRD